MDSPGVYDFQALGTQLFPGYRFHCPGMIAGWLIRALTEGKITISLWKKHIDYQNNMDENRYIYRRVVEMEYYLYAGLNYISLPEQQLVNVASGYLIGIDSKDSETNAAIGFDNWQCDNWLTCKFGNLFSSNEYAHSLMNTTERLTTNTNLQIRSGVYRFLLRPRALFPKIIPIVIKEGKLFMTDSNITLLQCFAIIGYLSHVCTL